LTGAIGSPSFPSSGNIFDCISLLHCAALGTFLAFFDPLKRKEVPMENA